MSPNNNWLFTSDDDGNLKQWSIKKQILEKDYGRVQNGGIRSMVVTFDNEFLFTGDFDGNLKQWSIKEKKLFKDYGRIRYRTITRMALI